MSNRSYSFTVGVQFFVDNGDEDLVTAQFVDDLPIDAKWLQTVVSQKMGGEWLAHLEHIPARGAKKGYFWVTLARVKT